MILDGIRRGGVTARHGLLTQTEECSAVYRVVTGSSPVQVAMAKTTKQGSHKIYGPKMADPRFTKSKEDRSCGPIGRYQKQAAGLFTSVKPYVPFQHKIAYPNVIRKKKRLQVTREEVLEFFELG